ncbi:MAG: TonB-dependent receptor [Pyrinomonadaceae bacterium]
MRIIGTLFLKAVFVLAGITHAFAQQDGSLRGQVIDTLGAVVVGATVTAVSAEGNEKNATSNQRGEFAIAGLFPGKYTVRATAPNFALYENTEVEIAAGVREEITVALAIESVTEEVEVSEGDQVSTDPNSSAGATVLKEQELEALPDDPEELEAALQALAGPSAGPNGGQIYIDGFTGGRMPPKESIREVRINQNPFSAEYDRLGFGRIEILTKPGSDKWRGSAFANFNDESLNSRNPFALNRAPSRTRFFGGNVSGPIQKGRSSFFLDVNNRDIDSNAVVNALILDASLNPVSLRQEFQVPNRRLSISPRFDYAINDNNTLVARYSFERSSVENQGIGNTSLPSRAYSTENMEHEIRLTETMIINEKTVNETRFEVDWENRDQVGVNSIPTVSVPDAFVGGGSQIGVSFDKERSWELQNYTTTSFGANSQHAIKFGAKVRNVSVTNRSENNFGGTFTFTNLANYVGAINDNLIPTQFTLASGNPEQSVSRTDYGLFVTDDWRLAPGLTISAGLRYENQTNINDSTNFAPRFSIAWSPGAGGSKAPKTVFRGGIGVFYDRFSEGLTLQAQRFNGTNQLNLIVNANDPDPARREAARALLSQAIFTLDGVSNVPTAEQILTALPQSNTIRMISPELQSPYTIQAAFGVERQLPARTTMSLFYIGSKTLHVLRSRNINAPICPEQINCNNAPRPDPTLGDLYQYESSGKSEQHQFMVNFRSMLTQGISLWGNYRYGFGESDSDGSGTFPAYSYDLSDEFARSSGDIRHNAHFGGSFQIPWGVSLSPFVMMNSGRPFNITRGIDVNGDALFTERPTYGQLADRCVALGLTSSYCDNTGNDPNLIIPRNYGQGPSFFTLNLRVGKNFGFGGSSDTRAGAGQSGGMGGGFPGMGGHRGGGGRGGFFGGSERKPYNLNLGVNFTNLFNSVNFNTPVGNLASSRFGQSTSTQGGFGGFGGFGGSGSANRRVELSVRFSW